jgi:hypothetical protein
LKEASQDKTVNANRRTCDMRVMFQADWNMDVREGSVEGFVNNGEWFFVTSQSATSVNSQTQHNY